MTQEKNNLKEVRQNLKQGFLEQKKSLIEESDALRSIINCETKNGIICPVKYFFSLSDEK